MEAPADLRRVDTSRVMDHVMAALDVRLMPEVLRKRRTVSGPTDAGTWLRVEVRSEERIAVQGWGGIEAAAEMTGVAKPAWYRSIEWHDPVHEVRWRADETERVTFQAVKSGSLLRVDPGLSQSWWATLRTSLEHVAVCPTGRVAKLGNSVASQDRVSALVAGSVAALGLAPVDSTVDQWASAHADLTWANLTAPECWVLDWEDWGRAPQGFDAACLLLGSLAVPSLAERVRSEFAAELDSRGGRLSVLAVASESLAEPRGGGEVAAQVAAEAVRSAHGLRD